jgi:hypothetical protein
MVRGRGAHQGVVHGAAGDADRRQRVDEPALRRRVEEARAGDVVGKEAGDVVRSSADGAGRRVNTEYVSNQAWPARPRARRWVAASVSACASWSPTSRATPTLVSTKASTLASALVGTPEGPDIVVAERLAARGRDDQPTLLLDKAVPGDRLDADPGGVGGQLHLTSHQPPGRPARAAPGG